MFENLVVPSSSSSKNEKCDSSLISNYRPISKFNALSKLLEKLIKPNLFCRYKQDGTS